MEKKFSPDHEWIVETEENTVKVGITDFAQHELGEIVFVNLFEVDDDVKANDPFGDVESVKAVSDLLSPVTGTIVAVNEDLLDSPELINTDADNTWMIEVKDYTLADNLMTQDEYEAYIKEQ